MTTQITYNDQRQKLNEQGEKIQLALNRAQHYVGLAESTEFGRKDNYQEARRWLQGVRISDAQFSEIILLNQLWRRAG